MATLSSITSSSERPTLTVVVACFNEETVIRETHRRLSDSLLGVGCLFEIIYVNDGSRDQTLLLLKEIQEKDDSVRVLSFSRNFGHPLAVSAGIDHAAGDAVVLIDADLQDPPEIIGQMVDKWREGYDVVYGQRRSRLGETYLKLLTAKWFYRIINALSDVPIPVDTGDFRLISRQVVEVIKRMPERDRFIRGMVSWVGFRQYALPYERAQRFAGESKYPWKKMLAFAIDGILSFSIKPLRLSTPAGFSVEADRTSPRTGHSGTGLCETMPRASTQEREVQPSTGGSLPQLAERFTAHRAINPQWAVFVQRYALYVNGRVIINLIGYSIITCFLYISLFLSLYIISAGVLTKGVVLSKGLLQDFQKDFYFDVGNRKFWQMQKDCIRLDDELIYIPRLGECRFRNPEFNTTLHFDETGRRRNHTPSLKSEGGIAVLGDSHAMGWGVEDHETFANVIQEELRTPVYNLAVSSYGTYRELMRLQRSDMISKIDTILIQYCDNDVRENSNIDNEIGFKKAMNTYQQSYKEHLTVANWINNDTSSTVAHVVSFVTFTPLKHFSNHLARIHWRFGQLASFFEMTRNDRYSPDFNPHYKELTKVFAKFTALLNNKRVVVFYINDRGSKLEGFPVGHDKTLPNIEFLELKFDKSEFYVLDGHLNPSGHKTVGETLSRYLEEH